MLSFLDPKNMPHGRFKAGHVSYYGRKHRVALVAIAGAQVQLGLADTNRCAADLEAAAATVKELAARHDVHVTAGEVASAANALQAHCRQITGWKPREPRR